MTQTRTPTVRHPRDDPREDVGVRVRVVECQLKQPIGRVPSSFFFDRSVRCQRTCIVEKRLIRASDSCLLKVWNGHPEDSEITNELGQAN